MLMENIPLQCGHSISMGIQRHCWCFSVVNFQGNIQGNIMKLASVIDAQQVQKWKMLWLILLSDTERFIVGFD